MSYDQNFLGQFKLKSLRLDERNAVGSAAERTEKRQGVDINRSNTAALIANYIDRFSEILRRRDPVKRERGIGQLKKLLHDQYIIRPEEIPSSYFASIVRRHRQEGRGDIVIPHQLKSELHATLITDQTRSLDAWIDYFASPDAKYPDALKFWVFRSILKMGRYDKEEKRFTNREGRGTVSPFPALNREALAFVLDAMEKRGRDETLHFPNDIEHQTKAAFESLLQKGQFSSLYAWAIDHINPVPEELMQETRGVWFTFPKGSDPQTYVPTTVIDGQEVHGQPLVPSIENYGTGWCLRGESTARRYLATSELQVFYSLDEKGEPRIPRVVTVKNDDGLSEVRGVAEHENLDSHIASVVQEKLQEFPDGKAFEKKTSDMKRLTTIERKMDGEEALTKEELLFLYEISYCIDGFGYETDPRIAELREKRNPEQDMPVVFGCTEAEIARRPEEITERTKAYVGPLESVNFALLPENVAYIYTSFPGGGNRLENLEIGGMTAEQLEAAIDKNDAARKQRFAVSPIARSMLRNKEQFINPVNERQSIRQGNKDTLSLIRLRVSDMGYSDVDHLPTTRDIFGEPGKQNGRIHQLGLDICPPETALYKRLTDIHQPLGEGYFIGMNPVHDSEGEASFFQLGRSDGAHWIHRDCAHPDRRWYLDMEFLLCRSKPDTSSPPALAA